MVLLDTNAILRYLLKDIPEQYAKVLNAVEAGSKTTVEILNETEHVLSHVYKLSREEISWYLHCLLLDVSIDNLQAVRYALAVYNQTSLDFVDCILNAYHRKFNCEILSFDKKLNKSLDSVFAIQQSADL